MFPQDRSFPHFPQGFPQQREEKPLQTRGLQGETSSFAHIGKLPENQKFGLQNTDQKVI